ncbi:MAG: c-type cytochrome [Deltaproteobacteria bacterium]|nr:MAG: c-type cytochrome [Deltaproteobacteria bacterium]
MMTHLRTGMMMGLVLTLSVLSTACQDPSPDKASLKYSEDLYDGCVQCHGENGEGNQNLGAPAIAGLERWYIKAQLRKFKKSQRGWHLDDMAGKRMQPMALALDTDEKVDLVAAYVASLPRTNPAPTLEGGNPETGKIYFATCVQCHGADARGNLDEFGPPLAGASDWYLLTQLQNFKAGVRGTHADDVTGAKMRPFSMTLANEQAMKDVIAYIATLSE